MHCKTASILIVRKSNQEFDLQTCWTYVVYLEQPTPIHPTSDMFGMDWKKQPEDKSLPVAKQWLLNPHRLMIRSGMILPTTEAWHLAAKCFFHSFSARSEVSSKVISSICQGCQGLNFRGYTPNIWSQKWYRLVYAVSPNFRILEISRWFFFPSFSPSFSPYGLVFMSFQFGIWRLEDLPICSLLEEHFPTIQEDARRHRGTMVSLSWNHDWLIYGYYMGS